MDRNGETYTPYRPRLPRPRPKPYRAPIDSNRYDLQKKVCPHCNAPFLGRGSPWSSPHYCSETCQQAARYLRRRAAITEIVRKGSCLCCGAPIADQIRTTRRYCSDKCRQRAYRQRVFGR